MVTLFGSGWRVTIGGKTWNSDGGNNRADFKSKEYNSWNKQNAEEAASVLETTAEALASALVSTPVDHSRSRSQQALPDTGGFATAVANFAIGVTKFCLDVTAASLRLGAQGIREEAKTTTPQLESGSRHQRLETGHKAEDSHPKRYNWGPNDDQDVDRRDNPKEESKEDKARRAYNSCRLPERWGWFLSSIDVSGASSLRIEDKGFVDHTRLSVDASGASSVRLPSAVFPRMRLIVDASGASSVLSDGARTVADRVNLDASGASSIRGIGALSSASVDASGASSIRIDATRSAEVNSDTSGVSSVKVSRTLERME